MKIVSLLSLVLVAGFCVAVSANEAEVAPVIAEAGAVVAPTAPAAVEESEETPAEGEEAPATEQN